MEQLARSSKHVAQVCLRELALPGLYAGECRWGGYLEDRQEDWSEIQPAVFPGSLGK